MRTTLADYFDEDPGSVHHKQLREDCCWLCTNIIECQYFLSWATGVNEFRRSDQEYLADYRTFVENKYPHSVQILASTYWPEFFLVILRQLYRDSEIGRQFPIRDEKRDEKTLRYLLLHPTMREADLVAAMKTTEKQLRRMSTTQLALREIAKLNEQQHC